MSEILDLHAVDLPANPPVKGDPRRLGTVVERLPVIVWIADAGGSASYFNARWFEYTGLGRAVSFERGWEGAVHPDDLPPARALWLHALESLAPFEAECRLRGQDGQHRWFLVRAEPLLDPAGDVRQWAGTCTDIEQRRSAEQSRLREMEDRFRSSVEALLDCFGIYTAVRDAAGRIVDFRIDDVNQAACDDVGISREQQVGTRLLDHLPWRGRAALFEAFRGVVETGTPFHSDALTLDVEAGDGSTRAARSFEVRATRLGDGLVAAWRDVTGRESTERAIRESEERYRNLFATMSEGFFVGQIVLAEDGEPVDFVFNEINPAFEKQTGLTRGQVLGRRAREVLPRLEDSWFARYGRVVLTGEPVQFTNYSAELDSHFQVVAFRPAPGQFAALFFNVNEQIRTRQALEETSRRLQAVLDVLPLPLFLADASGKLTATNPAARAFWGETPLSEGPASYREDYRAWWPRTGRRVESHEWGMARALASGQPVLGEEMEIETAAGERRVIHNYALPIRDAEGRVTGGVCVNVDLTDIRRTTEALREADRRKDEFLAMLAHELRNPLAAVTSAVQLLEASGGRDDQVAARRIIDRQARQLARLVDDLMDISRISSGKIQLRKERVDAIPALRRAIEGAQAAMEQKGHRFDASLPEGPLPIEADPARLEQMTVNLLYNAAKYTEPGGTISLAAAVEGDRLAIRVRDSGIGIAPEMQALIFEPFTQVDSSLARAQGGLGLGLALVKRLAELHGGSVGVASEGPGRGSEFTLRLPLPPAASPGPAPAPATPARAGTGRQAGTGLRILVVDDNRDMAESTAILLKLKGHQASAVHDGAEALAAARALRPDVILLDLGLPGMTGYEVAEELRADPAFRETFLIAISGYAQVQDRALSRASGIDHHLAKPVEINDLTALLDRVSRTRASTGDAP